MKHTIEMNQDEIIEACKEWLRLRHPDCYDDDPVQFRARTGVGVGSGDHLVVNNDDESDLAPATFSATVFTLR